MRKLEQIIKGRGTQKDVTFTQLTRKNNIAVYERTSDKLVNKSYEVIIIKERKSAMFKGVEIPEREVYPSDEDFGSTGFAYATKEQAYKKFEVLIK
jgi:hypothetical protein